ncbi:hypothetical protein H696_05843 [Fonticula alba]|uniref:Methyltransferase domain-containing protein n=1 Tax=Fonticula alba TaxID=691883 RepID=A0A058Z0D3_FONAL|nr:hypothetical protein H696_05843 [Fonticula alba]KCV67734.1 hypothetical protein H696_05843 [Fonticula alba]|eukprot:XP_009497918.1 hypothetical protein H696_05843 [Fonticula alba]
MRNLHAFCSTGDAPWLPAPSAAETSAPGEASAPSRARAPPRLLGFGEVDHTLEKHLQEDWWEDLFDEVYLLTDGDVVEDPAITEREVDLLLQILAGHLPTGACPGSVAGPYHLVDLCCGQGRHALELLRRWPGGLRVTGVDQSATLIGVARERAAAAGATSAAFHVADARAPGALDAAGTPADAVILMGNSLGYSPQSADDSAILRNAAAALRPGGLLVIDVTNGEYMRQNFSPRSWEWLDVPAGGQQSAAPGAGRLAVRSRKLSPCGGMLLSREMVICTGHGLIRDKVYAERMYSQADLDRAAAVHGLVPARPAHFLDGETSARLGADMGMMASRMVLTYCKAAPGEGGTGGV